MLLLPQESSIKVRPLEPCICLLHLALRSGRRRRVVKEIKLTSLLLKRARKPRLQIKYVPLQPGGTLEEKLSQVLSRKEEGQIR